MKIRLTRNHELIPAGTVGEAIDFDWNTGYEEDGLSFSCIFYGHPHLYRVDAAFVETLTT